MEVKFTRKMYYAQCAIEIETDLGDILQKYSKTRAATLKTSESFKSIQDRDKNEKSFFLNSCLSL